MYDYLIVGAGLFGATCARLLTDMGKKCLVIEQDGFVGGLAASARMYGIDVHLHGPHVLHTDVREVWDFICKYCTIVPYHHEVLAMSKDRLYHLPFNMHTFHEFFGITWPQEARAAIQADLNGVDIPGTMSVESLSQRIVGPSIYNELIKPYTEKLWGRPASQVPELVMKNIGIKFIYDNAYYTDKYQGVPEEGYTALVENMLGDDIDVMLNTNFLEQREKLERLAVKVIYTGPPDMLFDYKLGPLDWRSLDISIQDESETTNNLLGTTVVNFPETGVDWIRATEYKWFTPHRQQDPEFDSHTILSYEYPKEWTPERRPYYPANNESSEALFQSYVKLCEEERKNTILGGRFGLYRNLSMCETIYGAMVLCKQLQAQE